MMPRLFFVTASCVVVLAACCCAVSRKTPVHDVTDVHEEQPAAETDTAHKLEQEKAQKEMEKTEEIFRSTAEVVDKVGMLINEEKFGEAREVFDTNLHLITQSAAEGMADEDPEVAGLFKKWYDGLLEMREVLGREGLTPEKKRKLTLDALCTAALFKRKARRLQIFKR